MAKVWQQNISLIVDTGSSNTWFPSIDSNLCQVAGGCPAGIAYDPNNSSSFQLLSNGTFRIAYATGQATGDYISDTFDIGPASISSLTLGLADNAAGPLTFGIMGMGYESSESLGGTVSVPFPGVLTSLKQAGLIDRRAFSVYLDDQEAGIGSIIFGGYDSSKYSGDLTAVAITPNATGAFDRYRIDLTGVSFLDSTGRSTLLSPANMSAPSTLDTGATFSILPVSVTQAMVRGLGAVSFGGIYVADCALRDSNSSILFQFGGSTGPVIRVPISEMLSMPLGVTFDDGSSTCQLLVDPVDDVEFSSLLLSGFVIGDPVIRSSYAIYDVDNNEIYLAQAVFNQTGKSNIQNIPSGSGLPGVTSTATALATQFPTTFPPSFISQLSASLVQNQTTPTVQITVGAQIPTSPSSPTFNLADATGSSGAPTATTSSSAANRKFGLDVRMTFVVALVLTTFSISMYM